MGLASLGLGIGIFCDFRYSVLLLNVFLGLDLLGLALGIEECERMAADLLSTADARIMLLENHGEPRAVHSFS